MKKFFLEHYQDILFLILTVICFRDLMVTKFPLAYGDFSSFPLSYDQALSNFRYAWNDTSLGYSRHPGHFLPLLQALYLFIFRDPLLTQKVYILLLPILAYFSFKYFFRSQYPSVSKFAVFISALFYAYCPIFFQEFLGGTLFSTIISFALLPLLFNLAISLSKEPTAKKFVGLFLSLGLIFSINSHMILIFIIALFFPFLMDVLLNGLKAVKGWFYVVFSGILALLYNPIFTISNFNLVSTKLPDGKLSNFGNNLYKFIADIHYTYHWSNILNVLRLGNNKSIHGFDSQELWNVLFFIIVFLVLVTITYIIVHTKDIDSLLFGSFLSYLSISIFIFLTHLWLTDKLFLTFPTLFMFRNPAKLTYLNTFFFSILMAITINAVLRLVNEGVTKRLIQTGLLAIVLLYIWPVFLGDAGLSLSRDGYVIPEYYYKVQDHIGSNFKESGMRSFWYPNSHEGTSIKLVWLAPNNVESQLGLNEFNGGYYADTYSQALQNAIDTNNKQSFINLLNLVSVNNIVHLKSSDVKIKNVNQKYPRLDDFLNIYKEEITNDSYKIFLNTAAKLPIYTPTKIYFTKTVDSSLENSTSFINPSENFGVVDNQSLKSIISDSLTYLKPSLGAESNINYLWDKGWSWPEASYNPASPIYMVINLFENIQLLSAKNEQVYIEKLIWFNAKRLEEVDNYGSSYSYKLQTLNKYLANIRKIDEILTRLLEVKNDEVYLGLYDKNILYMERGANILKNNYFEWDLENYYALYKNIVEKRVTKYFTDCPTQECYSITTSEASAGEYDLYLGDIGISQTNPNNTLTLKDNNTYEKLNLGVSTDSTTWQYVSSKEFTPGKRELLVDYTRQDSPRMELAVDNHNEIIYKIDNVKQNTKYTISFDYSVQTSGISINVFGNSNLSNKNLYFNTTRTTVDKLFCAYIENGTCYRKASFKVDTRNFENMVLKVKNISMEIIEEDTLKLINLKVFDESSSTLLMVNKNNDTLKLNNVQGKVTKVTPVKYNFEYELAKAPFVLVLNQSFHSGWRAYIHDKISGNVSPLQEKQHIFINGYANGWIILPEDIHDNTFITIEFYPQNHLKQSLYFTGTITLICLLFLFRTTRYKIK